MKKISTLFFSFFFMLTLSFYALATQNDIDPDISCIYGISNTAIQELPSDIRSSLFSSVQSAQSYSYKDTYLEISYTEDGEYTITEKSYQEYLQAATPYDTDFNDWMRVHTLILDQGSYAEVSATYTWLTRPAFRMKDVVGLAITQGTFIDNTATGFYMYSTSIGSTTIDFSDTPQEFDYEGHGIVRSFNLAKPDEPVNSDLIFISGHIYKESGSEGLNGAYGHQRASIALVPSFNIDRSGVLSCVGLNIGMIYDQFKGYTSIEW